MSYQTHGVNRRDRLPRGVGSRRVAGGGGDNTDGPWIRWGASLALYIGVALLGAFGYWAVRSGEVRSAARVAVAESAPTGVGEWPDAARPFEVSRWLDRGVSRSRPRVRGSIGTGEVALASKVMTAPVQVGGEALVVPRAAGSLLESGVGSDARFFGHRIDRDVDSVVFVIDASGSMADTLGFVVRELSQSLEDLEDGTLFSVIFFTAGGQVLEVPPVGLKEASSQNKRRAIRWIQPDSGRVSAGGQTNPLAALRRGLSYEPKVIQLLSDNITGHGRWEVDRSVLLDEVARMNQSGVRIDTVQFLYADPLGQAGHRGTLWELSRQTGGRYQFVDGRELGIVR